MFLFIPFPQNPTLKEAPSALCDADTFSLCLRWWWGETRRNADNSSGKYQHNQICHTLSLRHIVPQECVNSIQKAPKWLITTVIEQQEQKNLRLGFKKCSHGGNFTDEQRGRSSFRLSVDYHVKRVFTSVKMTSCPIGAERKVPNLKFQI